MDTQRLGNTPDLLARLGQISSLLTSQGAARGDLERILALAAASAAGAVPGGQSCVLVYEAGQSELSVAACAPLGSSGPSFRERELLARALVGECEGEFAAPRSADPGRQAACLVLAASGETAGLLWVEADIQTSFSGETALYLQVIANLCATALFRERWLAGAGRELARKEEELDHLRRTGLLISSRLRLEETLEAILEMALELTRAQYGIFRLLDADRQTLVTRAVAVGEGLSRPRVEELPLSQHSVMGWVAQRRQPALIADLRAEPWSGIYYPLDAEMEMRSELAVPLVNASGRLEGVLNLESPTVGAFSESDSHMLQSLATQAVIAIQEARLLDALQEAALLLTQPAAQALDRLAGLACDLLNASSGAIWTLKDGGLWLQAAHGSYRHEERLPLQASLAGLAVLQRRPQVTEDVRADPRFNRPDLAAEQGWNRALVVPLLPGLDQEPLGAFAVYSAESEPGRFAKSEWDNKVLTFLAYYAALAVQNAKHQEALRAAQEQRALAETFAAVGDIAANVLHHLNNKVGAIPVRIQGIADKSAAALQKDAYLAANLKEIERSANEAMQAVRDNLANLRPIEPGEADPAACAQQALASAGLPGGVSVRLDDLAGLPLVAAGQRGLALVFANLFENAAAAMQGQGQIVLSGAARGPWVEITVSDSGPGIPPSLHERIFELNYSGRGHGRKSRLGFGLWWVKTLITRLGGSISVESDGSHGAAFYIKLPAARKNA